MVTDWVNCNLFITFFINWNYIHLLPNIQKSIRAKTVHMMCLYGSYRIGSRTLAISKMGFLVTIAKYPFINYFTKSSIPWYGMNPSSVYLICLSNSVGVATIVCSSILPFGKKYKSWIIVPASKWCNNIQNDITAIFAK